MISHLARRSSVSAIALLSWVFWAVACAPASATGAGDGLPEAGDETGDAAVASPNDAGPKTDAPPKKSETDAGGEPDLEAQYTELPAMGATDGPVIGAVTVKCVEHSYDLSPAQATSAASYPGAFAQILSVTDAQGVTDLDGPNQQLVLFSSLDGATPESHAFDIESYGVFFAGWSAQAYFSGPSGKAVREKWCARPWWPGEVVVSDETGHVTRKKVRIPVVR